MAASLFDFGWSSHVEDAKWPHPSHSRPHRMLCIAFVLVIAALAILLQSNLQRSRRDESTSRQITPCDL
jgi:hypothetical protein